MKFPLAAMVMAACLASGASAAPPAKNWTPAATPILAQTLSDETMSAHPDLVSVTLPRRPARHDRGPTPCSPASYPERIGNPDDPDDIDVIRKGITIIDPRWHRPNDKVHRTVVQLPLRDAHGENVGLIVYAFKIEPRISEVEAFAKASAMRDALEPRIPTYDRPVRTRPLRAATMITRLAIIAILLTGVAHAEDAAPLAGNGQTYGRHLAQEARAMDPQISMIGLSVGAPGSAEQVGMDPPSRAVVGLFAVPLKNVSGDTIGVIGVMYSDRTRHPDIDAKIQSYVAMRTLSAKNLSDPWPYDAKHDPDTYAQKLVDQTMRAHPELLVFAIHATPPGESINIIAGSKHRPYRQGGGRGRHPRDRQGLDQSGGRRRRRSASRSNCRSTTAFRQADRRAGPRCFAYHAGADKAALNAHAIAIRDELAKAIPTSAALFQPAH